MLKQITISKEQMSILMDLQTKARITAENFQMVATAVIAGFGIKECNIVQITPHANIITLEIPDIPSPNGEVPEAALSLVTKDEG